jgi:hypothetical protein
MSSGYRDEFVLPGAAACFLPGIARGARAFRALSALAPPISEPRRLGHGSIGDAQGRDIAIRPRPSGRVLQSARPASLHADLIGREGTGGNRHAGAVFYLKTQPCEAVHDKICNPWRRGTWRSVVGNDARRSSESAGCRRGSRVLRAILSDRELPELRTRQPALSQRSLPK